MSIWAADRLRGGSVSGNQDEPAQVTRWIQQGCVRCASLLVVPLLENHTTHTYICKNCLTQESLEWCWCDPDLLASDSELLTSSDEEEE